jgi:hypothetical protein
MMSEADVLERLSLDLVFSAVERALVAAADGSGAVVATRGVSRSSPEICCGRPDCSATCLHSQFRSASRLDAHCSLCA